jgi:hypothetical protein
MTPNMAAYHDLEVASRERVYAEAWLEANWGTAHAAQSHEWRIEVWSETAEELVCGRGTGFMGAFTALMEKLEERGIMGSFEVVR